VRKEANELTVGYSFDLRTNAIVPEKVANPGAGREHSFRAWRLAGSPADPVSLRSIDPSTLELEVPDEQAES
jgi:hypothetical protein